LTCELPTLVGRQTRPLRRPVLTADELDTHALNYQLLRRIERTPERRVTEASTFLASTEWEEHKLALARITTIPQETWVGLTHAFHNARELRARIELDGPGVPFPQHRLRDLEAHAEASEDLSEILADAASKIGETLTPPRSRRSRRRPFGHGLGTTSAENGDADERT
jgi:hypothetical protein